MTAVFERWRAEARALGPEAFFAALPDLPFAFLYGEGRFLILAEDPLLARTEAGDGSLEIERIGDLPPILPDFIGHATYEHGYGLDPLRPLPLPAEDPIPDLRLVLYRRVRLYDRETGLLYTGEREARRELEPGRHGLGGGTFRARKIGDSDPAEAYAGKVARIREAIAQGEVYQVNLTRQERWRWEGGLASFARRLHDLNPAPFSALVADPAWSFVSSSPESFLEIGEGTLRTRPIKGTAPRSTDPSSDRATARDLLDDPKNRSELAMIVDLMRNDLACVCPWGSVRVEAFPRLESYANVHHLVADVAGAWPGNLRLSDLLKAVFPGGSITGCPKLAAIRMIRDLEPWPRRIYTGLLGWCRADLQQAAFGLTIRTAWAWGRELRFGVGGGVVWDSDPRAEYEETLHKGRSLVQCLSS
ncbi:MAG TPA: anthranilate synthase component I family protein [Holophagaceae bacterium]